MRRLIACAGLALAASALLVGCSGGSGVAVLDTEQTEQDVRVVTIKDSVDPESTRLLAEHEGIRFYLGKIAEGAVPPRSLCLTAVPLDDPSQGLTACGGHGGSGFGGGTSEYDMEFVPDGGHPELEVGEVRVHENLIVRIKG
ncbi:hypothetical protein OH146_11835 [Salinibacterium sp. SYSU T00001]|uniref:hypothetical protein n=1 Tax=Homoserinimonas sedimenticola TaxID=2986805 RepID=UPI002236BB22|nr:hypothetical protein [Salinibacterium sedimenticola]MCW4386463.1 hypothetical protein [Salinibacterium sedimenticola]